MNKDLPIYQLNVSLEDELSGVEFVALVDRPAIEVDWVAFNEVLQEAQFKATNEEMRIISGALMIPDKPIYRKDKNGEYYVKFTAESIHNIVQKFFKEGNTGNVNEMHDPKRIAEGVYMIESFLINTDRMTCPAGFDLPNGSWFGSYKVDNEEIWQQVKDGTFRGFSVEGHFIPEMLDPEEALVKMLERIVNS